MEAELQRLSGQLTRLAETRRALQRSLLVSGAIAAVALSLGAFAILHRPPAQFDDLRTRRLAIAETSGRDRIVASVEGDTAAITLFDADGKPQIVLRSNPTENALVIASRAARDPGALTIVASDKSAKMSVQHSLTAASVTLEAGEGARIVASGKHGSATLESVDSAHAVVESGGSRSELDAGALRLTSATGAKLRLQAAVAAKLEVLGDGTSATLVSGTPKQSPSFTLTDATGTLVVEKGAPPVCLAK